MQIHAWRNPTTNPRFLSLNLVTLQTITRHMVLLMVSQWSGIYFCYRSFCQPLYYIIHTMCSSLNSTSNFGTVSWVDDAFIQHRQVFKIATYRMSSIFMIPAFILSSWPDVCIVIRSDKQLWIIIALTSRLVCRLNHSTTEDWYLQLHINFENAGNTIRLTRHRHIIKKQTRPLCFYIVY